MAILGDPLSGGSVVLEPQTQSIDLRTDRITRRRNRTAKSVIKSLGAIATYNDYLTVDVIHRMDIERMNDAGEIIIDEHQISFNAFDIPFAKSGDKFFVDGQALTIKAPITKSLYGIQTWRAV